MHIAELRKRHPRFVYDSFTISQKAKQLHISFTFILEPAITFAPQIVIPLKNAVDETEIAPLVFHLGLIEALSYWKAACAPLLIVNAGYLSKTQISWWQDLFLYGLGEFYFTNKIDFTRPDFLFITSTSPATKTYHHLTTQTLGDLVLVGGGKDSVVTLELLKAMPSRRNALVLNPNPAVRQILRIAKYGQPVIVERTIDTHLLNLNARGYLNGHTPFSAYLAFLGLLVGVMHSYKFIIASNERSSEEANVTYREIKVNHQYSKTYRFERLFREYCQNYLSYSTQYFSFLRPLYEFQIAALFTKFPRYLYSFVSCNRTRGRGWCGTCAKCAFVYLTLFSFLTARQKKQIFSQDFFRNSEIRERILDLVGLGKNKPFECVGTREESIMAVHYAYELSRKTNSSPPPFVTTLHNKLSPRVSLTDSKNWLRSQWSSNHFLPPPYASVLRASLKNLKNL